jgi:hypothetical protein
LGIVAHLRFSMRFSLSESNIDLSKKKSISQTSINTNVDGLFDMR